MNLNFRNMKKILLSLGLILWGFVGMGQIVTYNLAPLTGITASVPPTTTVPEVAATNLVRGSGLTPESAAGGYNSSTWNLTVFDANDYYEFTITPNPTFTINITSITIPFQKSATGPNNYEIRTQVGSNPEVTQTTGTFGTSGTASVGSINPSVTLGVVPSSTVVRFRIYAYGSALATNAGTLRITNTLSINGTAPLPITLISFKANITDSQQTVLKWATASEKDNDYFVVERSKNASDFESIGKIKGKGTIDLRNDYSFTDESPLKGINYYRLKQVDFDGQFSYTRVESVIKDGDGTISLYPNPTINTLKINFEDIDQIEHAKIYDMMGKVVKTIPGNEGKYEISDLSQGKYIIQIDLSDGRVIKNSFVKN